MIDTSLDIALAFLKAHPTWYIFPIKRLEKDPPLIKDNLVTASNDPKQIKLWHDRWRGCNWGLALKKSKAIVMDVDRKTGKNGQATLDTLTLEYGELPATLTVMSPSGGLHYYFEGEHRFGLGKYGFGPDVDSPNYVLIPGCWLCTNFEQGYETIDESPVALAPDWFGLFLKEKAERQSADAEAAVDLDKPENIDRMILYLQEGAPSSIQGKGGEKILFDVASVLKDNGISENKAVALLDEYYNVPGKCEPQWNVGSGPEADRLDIKVKNAYSYARENVAGSATAEFAFGDPADKITKEEVDSLALAWDVIISQQVAKRVAERKTELFTQEALSDDDDAPEAAAPNEPEIDPLTGEPYTDDPPPGGNAKSKKREKAESTGTSETPPPGKKEKRNLNWVSRNWVWVTGIERFVRLADGLMWSRTQFDSQYNHMSEKSSVSGGLFKTVDQIRRVERIAFRPGQEIFLDNGSALNLWRPSGITPKEGDTNMWDEHLNYLFQNPEDRDHVLNWLAWVVQNPTLKPNHALLLVGKNTGTGKSFIARVLEQLVGKDNTQRPKNSSLKGDFNGWALRCRLCIIEELMQIGRREVANELRDIITEPTIEVNIKNTPAQLVENYMAMMGISNHPDALPIDDTDRRWLVVGTNVYRKDPEYYRQLFKVLKSPEALGAIAHALAERDLGEYDASQAAPNTTAKDEMIQLSRSDTETWLFDNAENEPLSRNLVTVGDIIEAMPLMQQRGVRLNAVVQTFLRDRLRGEPIAQVRLNDTRKVRVWALHGKGGILKQLTPNELLARYSAERKTGGGASVGSLSEVEQAAEDFGEAAD